MAVLHQATLVPSKRELLESWLPSRPWFDGTLTRRPVASFRVDDPAGEVGIEGILLGGDGVSTLFLPLTYRGAPLDGADEHLLGTTEHSVLGTRWVYDGCGDPVAVAALMSTILMGGTEAAEFVDTDGELVPREPGCRVRGSGTATGPVAVAGEVAVAQHGSLTTAAAAGLELVIAHVVGDDVEADETLTATWAGGAPVVLAGVRLPNG